MSDAPTPKPTDYWSTPSDVVRAIEERLGWRFTLDMAARKDNAICPTYIGEPGDKDAVFEDFSAIRLTQRASGRSTSA